jgi:hypothetical protein
LKHLRLQSPFQKMWLIALHWAQLQSRFHIPLLQDPMVPAPHLEEGLYIRSLREFLGKSGCQSRCEFWSSRFCR